MVFSGVLKSDHMFARLMVKNVEVGCTVGQATFLIDGFSRNCAN